jgi:hypothetical protein
MIRRLSAVLAMLAALAAGCSNKPAPPAVAEASARPPFYYDLGATSIDVSAYPPDQRGNYKLFVSACATCHTPARPINAPIIGEEAWTQYVRRMHVKMVNNGIALSQTDEGRILSFLTYDSKARKTSETFKTEQERLKAAFESTGR